MTERQESDIIATAPENEAGEVLQIPRKDFEKIVEVAIAQVMHKQQSDLTAAQERITRLEGELAEANGKIDSASTAVSELAFELLEAESDNARLTRERDGLREAAKLASMLYYAGKRAGDVIKPIHTALSQGAEGTV